MSLIWIIIAGVVSGAGAKLLMPAHPTWGLFVLSFGGSFIAAVMQYSRGHAIGFVGALLGAVVLLAVYAATARPPVADKAESDQETRRAA